MSRAIPPVGGLPGARRPRCSTALLLAALSLGGSPYAVSAAAPQERIAVRHLTVEDGIDNTSFSHPIRGDSMAPAVVLNETRLEGVPVAVDPGYTNPGPGRYTFHVQAADSDGGRSQEGASPGLLAAPPWWRTWWAWILWALSGIGILIGFRQYEVNRIRLQSQLVLESAATERMREVEESRSRFFADVSHEFRTPLTLTLGPLDDLLDGLHGPLPPDVQDQIRMARRNAGKVLELINQMLELARLEAGRTPLRAERLDLLPLVEEAAGSFRSVVERRNICLTVHRPSDPVWVQADPEHLQKILLNLLSNAVKFTPEGGAVRITVEEAGDGVGIAVRDSGFGIPSAELGRIFERFYRADGPGRAQAGSGIGLSLAKELVELHGGTLSAESEVGFGSTFTVSLPMGTGKGSSDPERQEREDAPHEDPGDGSREPSPVWANGSGAPGGSVEAPGTGVAEDVTTILVVEDNEEVRHYLRKHLVSDYRVLEAQDGQEGLETARRELPDLILSDVMMSGLDGYGLCRALKRDPETDFIPVVLLTARAAIEDRLSGLHEQADDYITKPFNVEELRARVRNLIHSRQRLRKRFEGASLVLHPRPVEVESGERAFLEQVRVAIEENLDDETYSVERLARDVAHSRSHLHRRLRDLLDETPSDLIRRMRLERGAELIDGGAGTISTIAYSVGFKSVSHFSNRFQEHFGIRPSAYRDRPRA